LSSDLRQGFDYSNPNKQQQQQQPFPAGPVEFIDPKLLDLTLEPSEAAQQQDYGQSNVSEELCDVSLSSSPLPEDRLQEPNYSFLDPSLNTEIGAEQVQGSSAANTFFQQSDVLPFRCFECSDAFRTQGELNRHNKSHSKPHKCTEPFCRKASEGFRYSKDRDRHVRARHPHIVLPDTQVKYYCPVAECRFSFNHYAGWDRKDNYERHMVKYRNKQHLPPKPRG